MNQEFRFSPGMITSEPFQHKQFYRNSKRICKKFQGTIPHSEEGSGERMKAYLNTKHGLCSLFLVPKLQFGNAYP